MNIIYQLPAGSFSAEGMRIIGGSAKGRRLFSPKTQSREIRPTADRGREALFNIIGDRICGARVLDLFAGTGAFGCEALSRGAAHTSFVDYSRAALELVHKNSSLIGGGPTRSTILKVDLSQGLRKLDKLLFTSHGFDIIFADPPYLSGLSCKIVLALDKSRLLAQNPLVIIEEQKTFVPPVNLQHLHHFDTRTYGESSFFFYTDRICSR